LQLNKTYTSKMPLLRISFTILLLCNSLLIQACSTTNVVTSIVPGRELSRTSLGEREIDNRVIMDEVEPLSVKLYRRVSKVEYTKSEFRAVKEIRHEKTTYECSNAYDRYPAFLITTLAVPLLYEMATGFDILREMCEKNPPTAVIETAETDQILTRESFDKEKIVYQEIPIAGEPVTLVINRNKFVALTSSAGIAEFPAKEIGSFYDSEKSRSIDYQYNDVILATPFRMREPQKETKPAQRFVSATALNMDASAGTAGAMAAVDDQSAAPLKSAQENNQQGKENQPPDKNKLARKLNKTKQSYANEDENLKIIQQDKSIRIMNKSNLAMTVKRVSIHYNGRVFENLLSAPVVILPKSTSAELNRNNAVGEEFDDFESFGIAASYQIRSADREKSLSKVNLYDEDGVAEDLAESERLSLTSSGMAAKSAATAGNETLVAIGAEKTSDSPATGEWKIVLNIKFDTNKTTIKKEYFPQLKEIAEALKVSPGLRGVIEGHTDNIGSKELNQKISIRRAEAVAQHLTRNFGIAPDRLRVEGYGMSRPIADNTTPKGRAVNRRIEAKFKNLSSSSKPAAP
jgi:outer membrane protein OmpA-like peptidoglycan-associated protein